MILSFTFPFLPVCSGLLGFILLQHEADGRHKDKADTKIRSAGGRFSAVTDRPGLDGLHGGLNFAVK